MSTLRDENDEIFGRLDADGNVLLLYVGDGSAVTSLSAHLNVWPVGSDLGAAYEHPEGIVVDQATAKRIGVEIE